MKKSKKNIPDKVKAQVLKLLLKKTNSRYEELLQDETVTDLEKQISQINNDR